MVAVPNPIPGVIITDLIPHTDDRGTFMETWRQEWIGSYAPQMVQSNRSEKTAGSLVGLHYHRHQADYWHVIRGTARVVLHDLCVAQGATMTIDLTETSGQGVYIPPGVAHGFSALTDVVLTYLVDHYYDPNDELGLAWDDPDLAIDWGITDPVVSDRDKNNPRRKEIVW